MDDFERIELLRALSKLDKVDELVEALEEVTEVMGELITTLDNHAKVMSAATKKETPTSDVKPSN